jgi:putative transcriptional regulator
VSRKLKSKIAESVYETATGLYRVGLIDKKRMREYDSLCLQPTAEGRRASCEPLEPEAIKQIRKDANVSQAVFASILNTSISTIQKWEIGNKRPAGTALKLLHLVRDRGLDSVI